MANFVAFRIFAGFAALLCLSAVAYATVDDITRICKFKGCYDLDENDPRYFGQDYNRKVLKLFSSGIPQLLYENISSLLLGLDGAVSSSCTAHLTTVSAALEDGREWAFRCEYNDVDVANVTDNGFLVIDSSGKTPAAFLEGTVTSLGDYDECLAIRAPGFDIAGQYCMVDVFPIAYKGNSKKVELSGQISLATPRHFNASAYYFGLCFPSACSTADVRVLVKKVLEPFPLLVEGDLHCDTTESISFLSHFKNIRTGPLISLIFLLSVITTVAWGSVSHALHGHQATSLQKSFSVIENIHKLFYVSPQTSSRIEALEWYKALGLWTGVNSHIMLCIESLIGVYLLSHHKYIGTLMTTRPDLSPMFNEAGMVTITFLGGVAFFVATYPKAVKGKIPFKLALLDRVLRHLPGVVTIIALDMVWYLWGSGPFWTRVGRYQVDKCSKTWWKSFLFVANLWGPSSEICAGHTYYSSVDLHLFIIGFVAIILLAKRPKLGVTYCAVLSLSTSALTYYFVVANELTPSVMVPRDAYVPKIEQFLIYVHMATSTYVPSYLIAILVCYSIHLGWWTPFGRQINHVVWIALILGSLAVQQYSLLIPNYFNLLTPAWTPVYILFVRAMNITHNAFIFIYVSLFKVAYDEKKAIDVNSNTNARAETTNQVTAQTREESDSKGFYSLSKAFIRLSFSIYLSNYYFIRSDFFLERAVYYNSLFGLLKRVISSTVFIVVTATVFQIIFLGPYTNLRKLFFSKVQASQKKSE